MVPTELWPAYLPPLDGHATRRQVEGAERLEPDGAAVLASGQGALVHLTQTDGSA